MEINQINSKAPQEPPRRFIVTAGYTNPQDITEDEKGPQTHTRPCDGLMVFTFKDGHCDMLANGDVDAAQVIAYLCEYFPSQDIVTAAQRFHMVGKLAKALGGLGK